MAGGSECNVEDVDMASRKLPKGKKIVQRKSQAIHEVRQGQQEAVLLNLGVGECQWQNTARSFGI